MRTRRGLITSGLLTLLIVAASSAAGSATAANGAPRAPAATHTHDATPAAVAAHTHDATPGAVAAHTHDASPGAASARTNSAASADDLAEEREHMALDLAGTPMNVIEKRTAAAAKRIQSKTGLRPGSVRLRASAVAADPAKAGEWSPVVNTPVVPIFTAVLPNGKVLIWDSVGDNAAESYPVHDFTRVMIWNPADDTYKRVDVQGSNIFCAGFAHLADGNILVAGGNADAQLDGTVRTYVFDWQAETWTRGNDMASTRWYPSVAETANGEEVIIGGGPSIAEVYQNDGNIRQLTGFQQYNARLYPFLGSRPDTQLGLIGPYSDAYTIDTSGDGVITATGTRDSIFREYGSFASYDIGKSLVMGGGSVSEGGASNVPTSTAVVVDSNTGLNPSITSTGSLNTGRRQLNATLLADGSVLATGGETSAASSTLVDLNHAATTAERWDPATGTWAVLASASRIRQYHSTAVLLPDGRVMTGGGGVCGICTDVGYLEKNIEYFTPPYLYKNDGSHQLATRPVISAAPATVGIHSDFPVTTDQAASIRKVALVGLADATHSTDTGQRYVPLSFTTSGTTLTVTGPPTGGAAPPGYYMLFLIDDAGVPSVAKMVRVTKSPNPLMSPVTSNTGRCVDVPSSTLAIRTYLQGYDCNNTKAQALTRQPDDNSLRVLGNCVDVPSRNFVVGQQVWTYTCNNTIAQTWQFGTDATVRPTGNTALCLAAASPAQNAAIRLATCNTGDPLQKWTW